MARYQTYLAGEKKVIVVSRYAGKVVRGVAKCAPGDTFDAEKGEKLATARCAEKIAEKRSARAEAAYVEAVKALKAAESHLSDMAEYFDDTMNELMEAQKAVKDLEASM